MAPAFLCRAKDMLYEGVDDPFKQSAVPLHLHKNHPCVCLCVLSGQNVTDWLLCLEEFLAGPTKQNLVFMYHQYWVTTPGTSETFLLEKIASTFSEEQHATPCAP